MKPNFLNESAVTKHWRMLFLVAFFACSLSDSIGQSTDKFFGMNYWEYAVYGGVTTDKFKDLMPETSSWNLKIIRIGGNYPNVNKNQSGDKDWYVAAINNAKAIGGTPLVQLPIDLTATEVGEWMDYFNVTKNLGVIYWGIGNEPDPSSNYAGWYAGTATADGRTYTQFRSQFKTIAQAIKAKDANSVVTGPDFRHWWGSTTDAATPFGGWYKDFLYGAGTNAPGTASYNGDQLIDIFAFHFYGDGGSGNFDEGELSAKYTEMMKLIDAANALRPANQQLKIAVGEYNDNRNYTGFRVGQRMAIMSKLSLQNGAVYFAPWALCEGDPWSMIDKTTGVFYSSAHHYKMLTQNQRGNYMSSQVNNNFNYDIVPFGMQDANGYTIMLINEGATDYTFSVKFSTTAGNYSAAAGTLKFRFNANENIDFANMTLYKNSTLLFTFDAAGNMLKRMQYRSGDTAPVTTNYSVNAAPTVTLTAPVAGSTFEAGASVRITAEANAQDPLPDSIVRVEFFDNGSATAFHTENLAPYDFYWANFSTGSHTITAKTYDTKGATNTTIPSRTVTIVNTAPSVTMASNATTIGQGTTITLTATATDTAPGTVASVSYYDGATLLGTVATAPYTYNWNGASVGTHNVTARATDNGGAVSAASPTVVITVTNALPNISITAPATGASFASGATIPFTVNATDSDGTISSVAYYDGATLIGTVTVSPFSFSWNGATAGSHSVTARATDNNGGVRTSAAISLTVTAITQSPYGGTAVSLPGKIEAENYDLGGQGLAYNDATPGNSGGAYRTDDVDVQAATEGGYNIGYASVGDWTEYTVNVTTTGAYNFEFRVAAIAAGKTLHLEVDGVNISGTVTVPVGTSWQDFKSVNVLNKQLTQGQRIIRIVMETADLNINYVNVTAAVPDPFTQSFFNLVNKHSTHYLRPKDGSAVEVIVQDAEATIPAFDSFQWEFVLVSGTTNYYYIINKWTDMAIYPTGSSIAESVTMSQIALAGNENNQALQWMLEPVTGDAGYYWIKNRLSNKYIRPAGASQADLANIVQNAIVDTSFPSYRWSMINKESKTARISTNAGSEPLSVETTSSDVYPNPVTGVVTVITQVKQQSNVIVSMYNLLGEEVLSNEYEAITGEFQRSYDISHFAPGAFIVKIRKGDSIECKKVIKK